MEQCGLTLEQKLLIRLGLQDQISYKEFAWKEMNAIEFIKCVYKHHMVGWFLYHLKLLDAESTAEYFWGKAKAINAILAKRQCIDVTKQDIFITKMLDIFRMQNIRGVVMKGPVLQSTLYAEFPYARPFDDLDVLFDRDTALGPNSFLIKKLNFHYSEKYAEHYDSWHTAMTAMCQHLVPLSDDNGVIEIHLRLGPSFMKTRPNIDKIIRNAHEIQTKWGFMYVPDCYDMLIMLCYHMYYHQYYENEMRMAFHVDIINWLAYLQKMNPDDWINRIVHCTDEHNMYDVVAYCIVKCYQVLQFIHRESIIPKEIIELFINDNSKAVSEEIHSRAILSEKAFGCWAAPYVNRLFIEKQQLDKELACAIFHNTMAEKWKSTLHSIGIHDLQPENGWYYW